MGMYTEIVCGVSLKKQTPPEVIEVLKFMVRDLEEPPKQLPDHAFFEKPRWDILFVSSSSYFGYSSSNSKFHKDTLGHNWLLTVRASIKNYDREIEAFFEWIKPYVNSGSGIRNMMGYSIYEEADVPEIYYAEDTYQNGLELSSQVSGDPD